MKQNHAKIIKQILIVLLSFMFVLSSLGFVFCFSYIVRMSKERDFSFWLSLLLSLLLVVLTIYGAIRLFKQIKNP
jgi:magnesium-transporting ATPase (P-type)